MKIQKDDIYCSDSLTVVLLNKLQEEENRLRSKANRIEQLNCALTAYIEEGKITDTNEVSSAIAWLYHSNLSPIEIIEKVLDKEGE